MKDRFLERLLAVASFAVATALALAFCLHSCYFRKFLSSPQGQPRTNLQWS